MLHQTDTRPPTHPRPNPSLPQVGAGTTNQRVVEPGKGLVGQVATGAGTSAAPGDGDTILMTNNPSEEKAFCAEVDLPRSTGEGMEAAGDW